MRDGRKEVSIMRYNVPKAIIPAAGLGTRLGPITQVIPKEMFPLNRRAVIEYAIDEAITAGISTIGIVIRKEKKIIRDYLSDLFLDNNKVELIFIEQAKPLGLGDAILGSQEFVGKDPFIVILPDNVFQVPNNPTRDLIEFFSRIGKTCFCIIERSAETVHRYGSLSGERMDEGVFKITYISSEFNPDLSFGNPELRGCGRTIFTPNVFEFFRTDRECELGDGELLSWLIQVDEVWGLRVPYQTYDTGVYDGYVEAVEAFWQMTSESKTN